jgi:hypothetical protein
MTMSEDPPVNEWRLTISAEAEVIPGEPREDTDSSESDDEQESEKE